ncbi:MAG: hypothetical protein D3910_02995, partial [Candidatus Electrothrix sp. ATG2]|nr:hypothetical protein [Candidatus Electrothrix sp. ATG2]
MSCHRNKRFSALPDQKNGTLGENIMKSSQMSINKLVIYLELATLGLTLVILFLSSLGHKGNIRAYDSKKANKVVQAAKSVQKEAQAPKTALLTDVHVPPRQREIWFGDLDGILQRGQLRILLPFSRTFFFQKNGQNLGLSSEVVKLYKQFLNDQVILGEKKIQLVFLPTPQEQLIEDLLAGKGDIAVAANMELPAVQEKLITFVSPIALEIQEILVTGANPLHFKSIFNLSGQTITLRENSPYAESLRKLNNTLVS